MTWIILIVLLAIVGTALWRLGIRSRDVDEDIKDMNQGRGPGIGMFGIFRRKR